MSSGSYRYGFNGKENDNDVKGSGNSLDFGARIYDSRLGRWLCVDPITHSWQSPYVSFDNNPIAIIDPDGRSTHTDSSGKVIGVYNDGNKAVYWHKKITSNEQANDFRSYYDKHKNFNDEGTIMGRTLKWDSFLDEKRIPAGRINFHSNEGMSWVMETTSFLNGVKDPKGNQASDDFKRMFYALNAGSYGMFDFKRGGMPKEEFEKLSKEDQNDIIWRGSQLSKNLYASARDFGNYMAGVAARLTNQDYKDFLQIAGSFNRNRNEYGSFGLELLLGIHQIRGKAPTYGELPISNFFQRVGYHLIKTEAQLNSDSKKVGSDLNQK